jgi:peptidoglycan-N-acetylglucosamine deacetylase
MALAMTLGMALPAAVSTRAAQAAAPTNATVDHPPVDGVTSFDNGPRSGRLVALTFDADMTPGMLALLRRGTVQSWYNREVIDVLRAERVPATLFLTGLWASTYPGDARALAADPLFEIGSHTFDHAAFRTPCYGLAAASDRGWELDEAQRVIQAVTGTSPTLVRFPGDCYRQDDVHLARQKGLNVISGDVRAGDGFNPSAAAVANRVISQTMPGSIVVMHLHGPPYAPMTATALRHIIPALRQQGFEFATVGRLLGLQPAVDQPAAAQVFSEAESSLIPPSDAIGPVAALKRHRLQAPQALLRSRPGFWLRLLQLPYVLWIPGT